jgi:DNA-binding NarL/FixJ family response regulator
MERTSLSGRERQIMQLLLKGMANKDIAEQLYVSERTVKFHCSNLYKKLKIQNRFELMKILN